MLRLTSFLMKLLMFVAIVFSYMKKLTKILVPLIAFVAVGLIGYEVGMNRNVMLTVRENRVNTLQPAQSNQKNDSLSIKSKSVCDEILKRKVIAPVKQFNGTPVKVNFSSRPEAKSYYTRITEGVSEGPNFAGHYRFEEWGCGTECIGYAIVDLITGNIIDFDYGGKRELYPYYYADSRLLTFNSKDDLGRYEGKKLEEILSMDEIDMDDDASNGREYYELNEETNGDAWLYRICTENAIDGIYSY